MHLLKITHFCCHKIIKYVVFNSLERRVAPNDMVGIGTAIFLLIFMKMSQPKEIQRSLYFPLLFLPICVYVRICLLALFFFEGCVKALMLLLPISFSQNIFLNKICFSHFATDHGTSLNALF